MFKTKLEKIPSGVSGSKKIVPFIAFSLATCFFTIAASAEPETTKNENPMLNVAFIAIGAVVLIAIVATVIFFYLKNKSNASARNLENDGTAVTEKITIKCDEGYFAGQTFDLIDTLLIGRKLDECDIIYPVDAEGISNVHCELARRDGKIILTDKNSTYGTFQDNGTRLQKGESIEINHGECFYLAKPENKYIVM